MKSENKTEKRQRAKKLVRQYQLSQHLAFAVVNNECSLHEAIVRSREELEIELMEQKHNLNAREVAQIKNKEATLHDILVLKNTKKHIDETDANPSLIAGVSGHFWRHQESKFQGEIIAASRYDLEFLTASGSLDVPKLHIKAFSSESVQPIEEGANDQEPIIRVEERFRISNKQLYRFVLDKKVVRVTLLGGLIFEGSFLRIGRYECSLLSSHNETVILMRHAFASVEEVI